MRVLVVANSNRGRFSPFVVEQVEALRRRGVEVEYFGVKGKGMAGYLRNLPALRRHIAIFRPDVIHAHYGLSGLLANLQRAVPVVTTYHGSDIHSKGLVLFLSKLAIRLSQSNIFVSRKLYEMSAIRRQSYAVIPCGIDTALFSQQKGEWQWGDTMRHVVFAGAFSNAVKNAPLAQRAVERLENTRMIELKGFTREEVVKILRAADSLIMTSHREGSPQVIKEAVACGCPIVSVDVGDVCDVLEGIPNCFIADRDPGDIAEKLQRAASLCHRTDGMETIHSKGLSNDAVAERILEVYNKVIEKK